MGLINTELATYDIIICIQCGGPVLLSVCIFKMDKKHIGTVYELLYTNHNVNNLFK